MNPKSGSLGLLVFLYFGAQVLSASAQGALHATEMIALRYVKCIKEFKSVLEGVIDNPTKLDSVGAGAEKSLAILATLRGQIDSQLDFLAKKESEITFAGFAESDRKELREAISVQRVKLSSVKKSLTVWENFLSEYEATTAEEWKSVYNSFLDIAGKEKAKTKLFERIHSQFLEMPWPESDPALKLAVVKNAAQNGEARAQFDLGNRYARGDGVIMNAGAAASWYLKAAEQGLADAQFALAICYGNGDGVDRDAAAALNWVRKAATQGNADAQFNLGIRYAVGEGVEKNLEEALYWYRKAAAQGNADAQYILGVCYATGDGVVKDSNEARKWYRKAAAQGNQDANTALKKSKPAANN
jgi:hypothetical protein